MKYDITLDKKTLIGHERGLEIKKYLLEHRDIEQYVLLDDKIFDSFDEELMKNLILTNENQEYHRYGEVLQLKHIKQIINRFGIMQKDERKDYDGR